MPLRVELLGRVKSSGAVRRALRYAFYDWTREMPKSKRLLTRAGLLIQGYAIYAGFSRTLIWPLMWPKGASLYAAVFLVYYLGHCLMNATLTSEFVRKTQLEAEQIAARQIQQSLQPENLEKITGYEVETFYKPFRDVGGDYFDIIELPDNRTLFALADVSGKGMPAALLAANIQALVRSIAIVAADPLELARQINRHLIRYTPSDRFATAVFIVLRRDSGKLTYVNAGHVPPIVFSSGSTIFLEATGMPLGLFADAEYQPCQAVIDHGGALLIFTDGLPDSISEENPENSLRDAVADDLGRAMSNLKSLVDPEINEDDVTVVLVRRTANSTSNGVLAGN